MGFDREKADLWIAHTVEPNTPTYQNDELKALIVTGKWLLKSALTLESENRELRERLGPAEKMAKAIKLQHHTCDSPECPECLELIADLKAFEATTEPGS